MAKASRSAASFGKSHYSPVQNKFGSHEIKVRWGLVPGQPFLTVQALESVEHE